ncbi:hypothetical protein ACB092_03G019600 [Castanea dentata]
MLSASMIGLQLEYLWVFAWTDMGGSTLYIKATQIEQGEGKGALSLPGQLGDVMKESAQLAHIVARSMLFKKEPDNRYFANSKLYLHAPMRAPLWMSLVLVAP